ncbi:RagB/SusD family nutrient uptake outer membrane protein [Sinomicrobium weinanense]|uniref:RagB/SusD family nutrient uptake outer membrane protein n=1 Tax=Sinomicrobium weinanense TaxID=2842200 RepID=A0A926Q1C9_9FLAO|nr:RagB/SusD family nutrient uptake outer membrane protein [Sinomicrobium weinanense]MBC9795667.1 RagB/SusD family nutrient uptake outer membrane protein [Sinomicrobium weinanense]MBU3122836.1 RagB/SusD family nutrient uptake outer membrane protein [Sinomicrobium weinanense]
MKKIIFSIALSTVLFAACNDELDLDNPNAPKTAAYWSTEDHAVEGINAVYNSLLIDGYYMRMTPALTDGRGDDFKGDSPWLDLIQVANFTILPTSGPVQWMWSAYYQQVFRANQVLTYVPEIEMDEALRDRCLGQAYFLRGLAYFHLVTNFEKVPLILSVPVEEEEYYEPTATQEVIWEQIISDFSNAQEMLPVDYASVDGPDHQQKGRATKGAATGFLGKSYLYTRKWPQAAAEFRKLIEGPEVNIYGLMDNYRDNFSPGAENNKESLFEVQFATPEEVGGTVMNYGGEPGSNWRQVSSVGHTYAMDGYGYSDFLPTRWVYEEFKKEKTMDGKSDPRLLATIASYEPGDNSTTVYGGTPWPHAEGAIYPRKYTHDGLEGYTTESQGGVERSGINYRLMRYADVLLMYAEALNEMGQTSDAYNYIQQVRDRASLPDLSVVKPGMGQDEMRDQIAHERTTELSIESIRIHDIIRWGWLYDEEKLAELKQRDADFVSWSPGKEYLPIPQTELDINPNLEPNSAN